MQTVPTTDEVQLGLRVPRALRAQLERVAAEHQSSISGATRYLLRRALAEFDHELLTRRVTPDVRLRT